jgi:DNA-binding transcriptional regulator YdaS (Cro superfamily)
MDKLLAYLNGLPPDDQKAFATRCNTTVGYLRKACSVGQQLGDMLCLRIGIESAGAVPPEELAPSVDWQYLRAALITAPNMAQVPANHQQFATESVAQGV